jgi:hypothetical protein
MGYLMADPQNLKSLSAGLCDPGDTETAIRELVAFLAAGLRAPAARVRRRKSKPEIRNPKSETNLKIPNSKANAC